MSPKNTLCVVALASLLGVRLASCDDAAKLNSLIGELKAESREERIAAAKELGRLGPAAAAAAEPLSALVLSSDWRESQPAAAALIGIDPAAAMALLQPRLTSGDRKRQEPAVKALEYVGPPAAPFAALLTEVVRSSDHGWTRAAAANGLGQIGPAAAEAVPVLTEGLAHETEYVRRYCARGLGGIGAAAAPALPALEEAAAREPGTRFAKWALEAAEQIRAALQKDGNR